MRYNNKIYAKLGRELVSKHPQFATALIENLPSVKKADLNFINKYFVQYCFYIQLETVLLTGPVYLPKLTEYRKIFISAMVVMYNSQYLLQKNLCNTLSMRHSAISDIASEVKIRYQKDKLFTNCVDDFLNQIDIQKN